MRELIAQIVMENHVKDREETFQYIDIATEGIVTGMVADIGHSVHNSVSTGIGWFQGVKKKRESINEIADATIEWLKEEDKDNPKLELDMGSFKTWLKTSELKYYRYYYLLSDPVYNEIVSNLKNDEVSELEDFFGHFLNDTNAANTMNSKDMQARRTATRMLDSIRTIKDLILVVDKYKARANMIFELMEKRDRSIKGFPFQLMKSGANDLRQTVKKIVNLAV